MNQVNDLTIEERVTHKAANLVQAVISYLDLDDYEFAENLQKDIAIALQAQSDDMKERAASRADGSLLIGSEIAKEIRSLK